MEDNLDQLNPIYMMANSGARGSFKQIRQLAGHARPDGQPEGRDHRAADQGQLHGGPDGARVLHLDPRRPQGPRRHRAAHRRLGLPDAASGRRRAGRDHPRRRTAAPRSTSRSPLLRGRRRRRTTNADRPRRGAGASRPSAAARCSSKGQEIDARGAGRDRRGVRGRARQGRADHRPGPLGAQVRGAHRRVPGLLRPLAGLRQAGPDRRRGGHHRRAVDRRAGHAADHADVPHRRRRRRGHHARPAARRRAVRGAQAQGPGEDRRGRRQGRRSRTPTRRSPSSSPTTPARSTATRSRAARACSSTRARRSRPGTQLNEGSLYPHELLAHPRPDRDRAVPRQGGPGGLQVPGRGHQRQAHRADRAPDAQEGAGRPEGRHRPAAGPVRRPPRATRASTTTVKKARRRAGPGRGDHPRHHQGLAGHGLVPVGGLLPGDHQGAHRRGARGQDRPPQRA